MGEEVWVDSELVPDPDALEEMGSATNPVVTDADVKGSRLIITKRCAAASLSDGVGGVIELFCTFHPAHGMRFTSAALIISLTQPSAIRITDIEPKLIRDTDAVRYTVDDKGKFSLTLGKTAASGEVDFGQRREFARYHCSVRGSGAGSAMAQWTFAEEPNRREGLEANQTLVLTTNVTGIVSGHIVVSARLVSENGLGRPERFRDMILRPQTIERHQGIQLDIPQTVEEPDIARFRVLEVV